jgi:hypothetical protein
MSVRSEYARSPVRGQADRGLALWNDMSRACPRPPRGGRVCVVGMDEPGRWALCFGDLFRVMYRDPALRVEFVERSRACAAANGGTDPIVVQLENNLLRPINAPP